MLIVPVTFKIHLTKNMCVFLFVCGSVARVALSFQDCPRESLLRSHPMLKFCLELFCPLGIQAKDGIGNYVLQYLATGG